ncbi:MAG TPA: hypothetical protein VFG30_12815 [Polyangiales bacterium]|nr:hypothetical protein [Polyangiales bacterium]
MSVLVAVFHSRASVVLILCALLGAACGGPSDGASVSVGGGHDAGDDPDDMAMDGPNPGCDMVELDGDFVVEHEKNFTARYRIGERSTKTIMLFGGEPVEDDDVLSNAYILGLDKEDALMLAELFPDFYLCSSPGGDAAADHIFPYDLVPANCEVYEKLVNALTRFRINRAAGGDRTSLRIEGAPLELVSVIDDASGVDVTDQVTEQHFHLVTEVEQLTGESVLEFGTTD